MTELEMREQEVPWPKTKEELCDYIDKMTEEGERYSEMGEGYGKAVYVMSMIATAAFNLASHIVGASGFQASCADMDFLRRTRRMKNGFRIIDYQNLLYPQYEPEIPGFWKLIEENKERLKEEAKKLLSEEREADEVRRHWEKIASLA